MWRQAWMRRKKQTKHKNVSLGILPINQSPFQMDMFQILNISSFLFICLFSSSIYLLLTYAGFLIQNPDWITAWVIVDQSVKRSLFI